MAVERANSRTAAARRRGRRMTLACLVTLVLTCASRTFAVFTQVDATPPGESAALSEQQQRQLQIFSRIVLNSSPDIAAEIRRNAALELVALGVPEAIDILDQALRSQKAAVMLAAISAMQSSPSPIPQLLDPALAALPTAPESTVESLGWALARYGSDALDGIIQLATQPTNPVSRRFAPIQALSAFDSQAAAAALMGILNDQESPAEITVIACESLQRLSGLSYGTDVAQWGQWWREAGSLPAEEWSAYINKSLSRRAAQLQQELQKQRDLNDQVARELQAAYRELYPALATDEQLRRLPALLQNQFAAVREFAVNRVTLLLRDSVRIPIEVQHKLAERLADESAAVRIHAAKALDELNYENVGAAIAARLAGEQSPQVIAAFFEVLVRRPTPAALEVARKALADPAWRDQAAALMWEIHKAAPLNDETLAVVRTDAQRQFRDKRAASLARLLAWIGADDDVPALSELLAADDPAMRAAVAEGFCQRGLRQPLVDRASDPVVYPFALRVVADGRADVASFALLVGLAPDESQRKAWSDAVMKLAAKLSSAHLIAADDALLAASHGDVALREMILARAVALPPDELPNGQRTAAIARLAPMLLERGEAARAHALLDSINCQAPALPRLCFEAAALAGHYDKAAQLQEDAGAWVSLLARAAQQNLDSAAPLCREILRRFNGRLEPDDQAIVDDISESLRDSETTAAMR